MSKEQVPGDGPIVVAEGKWPMPLAGGRAGIEVLEIYPITQYTLPVA
ncbi:hypothetical protein [Novipirellula artificiosorum]|nr:hypothetical protein [Novipirellula artificiosorum]